MSSVHAVQPPTATSVPAGLEAVSRISKLPVVDSTIELATGIYQKVKGSNSVVEWTLDKAENTVQAAVQVGKPVAAALERPIRTVDGALCSSLDYVESKVPAVKLPTQELYEHTKQAVADAVQPVVAVACSVCGYGLQKINEVGQLLGRATGKCVNLLGGFAIITEKGSGPEGGCAQCREELKKKREAEKKAAEASGKTD